MAAEKSLAGQKYNTEHMQNLRILSTTRGDQDVLSTLSLKSIAQTDLFNTT